MSEAWVALCAMALGALCLVALGAIAARVDRHNMQAMKREAEERFEADLDARVQ